MSDGLSHFAGLLITSLTKVVTQSSVSDGTTEGVVWRQGGGGFLALGHSGLGGWGLGFADRGPHSLVLRPV